MADGMIETLKVIVVTAYDVTLEPLVRRFKRLGKAERRWP